MIVRKLQNQEEFLQLRESWDHLLQKCEHKTPFSTFEWLWTWWKHFGQNKELYVLTVEDEGELLAIAPLMRSRRGPFRMLEFLGTGRSDYLNFILMDKHHAALHAVIGYLADHQAEWDLISLQDWASDSPFLKIWRQLIVSTGWTQQQEVSAVSPFLPCQGTWEEYLQSKSTKHRKNLKRLDKQVTANPEITIQQGRA